MGEKEGGTSTRREKLEEEAPREGAPRCSKAPRALTLHKFCASRWGFSLKPSYRRGSAVSLKGMRTSDVDAPAGRDMSISVLNSPSAYVCTLGLFSSLSSSSPRSRAPTPPFALSPFPFFRFRSSCFRASIRRFPSFPFSLFVRPLLSF